MHNHKGQFGPPFDASKKIDCPDCVKEVLAYRSALCERYGWNEWPWGNQGLDI